MRWGRAIGRGLTRPRTSGIRFRLGTAMAIALLPILILGALQMRSSIQVQRQLRDRDLTLAVGRAAAGAESLLNSSSVLLTALKSETPGPACSAQLADVVGRLEDVRALYRFSATGHAVCQSRAFTLADEDVRARLWFPRVRSGEELVVTRTVVRQGEESAITMARRLERPLGRFDGAMVAIIPLRALQPEMDDPALPTGSEVAVVDAAGNILIASDPAVFKIKEGQADWMGLVERRGGVRFEAVTAVGQRRTYAGGALVGGDLFILLSAPEPGLWSWARLNPFSLIIMPLLAWFIAFVAVMVVSERVVVRWLDYLERIAGIYAKGRFNVRPVQAENGPAEIASLGRALDELGETITRRDAAIATSIAEKDGLMREIHHRVKNNLQIISSLLSLQQRALDDPRAKAAVGDTRQRITALALIYRTLYQSDDLRYADARMFITDLVGQLIASDAMRGPVVETSVEADSLVVDPDKLAPLALWLVEAVSNAQKHAFMGRGGRLQVRFKVQGDTSVLEVQDDGPGVSDSEREGVGRTLMGAFAKQLRGEAELALGPDGGSIARLTFATPEAVVPNAPSDAEP